MRHLVFFFMSDFKSRFGPAFRPLSCTPSCSFGTALTGVGVVLVASMPPGGIAGVLCGYFLCFGCNREYLFTLASSKHQSVTQPVSKAFSDSNVTDDDFCNGSEQRFEG